MALGAVIVLTVDLGQGTWTVPLQPSEQEEVQELHIHRPLGPVGEEVRRNTVGDMVGALRGG